MTTLNNNYANYHVVIPINIIQSYINLYNDCMSIKNLARQGCGNNNTPTMKSK